MGMFYNPFVLDEKFGAALVRIVHDVVTLKLLIGFVIRDYALAHFRKEDRYTDYLRLYDELTGK